MTELYRSVVIHEGDVVIYEENDGLLYDAKVIAKSPYGECLYIHSLMDVKWIAPERVKDIFSPDEWEEFKAKKKENIK